MRSAIFITARTKSTRLPKKILRKIKGRMVIDHLIDRLKLAKRPDLIVLCTSTNPDDDILIERAKANGIEYFRGSEDDVLDRFSKAAKEYEVDFIVVTWGDELFCDPEYVDKTVELFEAKHPDLIISKELPLGTYTYGVKIEALNKVCAMKKENDTEVWGKYFMQKGMFNVQYLHVEDNALKRPEIRITLDYPEDLKLVRRIFDHLYEPGKVFSLRAILQLLNLHPELMNINKDCQKQYDKRIEEQSKKTRY